ncbi:MAG: thioredoxin domain-containing protein [Winogradskyella sp.]|nr:thioredoxin domain-containing protein [Winogradskyella sp.]
MEANKTPNDLIHETSPYLLQHAYNPVNWKAWNDETLKLAKAQNKLIVISVGYSACHWCHVMEEESFENDSIARIMNENFINIKVDREERPDIDQIYMSAVQLMTGSAGWPLNCITLPDGRPVFGGTYFTKNQWSKILEEISDLYETNPQKVIAYAEQLTAGINKIGIINVNKKAVPFEAEQLKSFVEDLKNELDFENGGKKGAPKFPMPSSLNFLLRYSVQFEDETIQQFVMTSLTKMANGGIYDQIGGGFSRYSVDGKWHVPHFEKMLYDNAQLVSLYSKAYQITKNKSFKTVVIETLDFIERELMDASGSFYSSLDADSKNKNGELEEGIYYTWHIDELKALLREDFKMFKSYYNINAIGKWEDDQYILYKTLSDEAFARSQNISLSEFETKLLRWKAELKQIRNKRIPPRRDEKVLTSWNAIMLNAYVDAFKAFKKTSYLKTAIKSAKFLKENQIQQDNSMYHNYKNGVSTIDGFSEDYAHTISAFIELYQVTLNEEWLDTAKALMEYTMAHFLDKDTSMFYFTSNEANNLIARKTEVADNVIPSSNSVLAHSLYKLGKYYSNKTYKRMAEEMLTNIYDDLESIPTAYTNWMTLYLNYVKPHFEVAICGEKALAKLDTLNQKYLPNIILSGAEKASGLPLLKNKYVDNETLIYVCVNGTCKLPVQNVTTAIKQISN